MEARFHLKQEVQLEAGKTYSICLRGARKYDTGDEAYVYIYTPEHFDKPKHVATIENQKQFRFSDLLQWHCEDNYDAKARSISNLTDIMLSIYKDFEPNEIVTIVKFKL